MGMAELERMQNLSAILLSVLNLNQNTTVKYYLPYLLHFALLC